MLPALFTFRILDDTEEKRVLIELRLNQKNEWWLDAYMLTDREGIILVNKSLTHSVNEWVHASIKYKNNVFTSYVNGIEELNGQIGCFEKLSIKQGKLQLVAKWIKEIITVA